MSKDFVHLHLHSEFSLLDGVARIKKVVELTKARGYSACAITDHGNMFGTLQFYEECIKAGIKPILGCEFYICNDLKRKQGKDDIGHIVLLAKNNDGLHNLYKLNEIAYVDGFYYKPRIDYETLEKHSEGVICLSACLAGHIPQFIMQRRYDEADKLALRLKSIFKDDFYLELQDHGIEEQKVVNAYLIELAKRIDVKLVATNDVHYVNKDDAEIQDVLMCVQMGKFLEDQDRMKFSTNEFYLKTREEMEELFPDMPEVLDVTTEIANKCDIVLKTKSLGEVNEVDAKYKLPSSKNYIPVFKTSTGEEPYAFLRRICYEGLEKKYPKVTQELIDRLEMELTTIKEQGFVEYILIVWDYINWANENGIPVGPGRGSGAGSLVCYTSGVTRVDPIKYSLFFERFINKERVSMPDIDVDFCTDRRPEVIEYVRRKYGEDHVALISTFGRMQAKNAIRDVGRVLRMPYSEVDKITKLIPAKLPDGIKKPPVLKFYFGTTGKEEDAKYIIPELKEMYDTNPEVKRVADIAIKLEGVPRNTSTHAAGVLISPEPVSNFVPLSRNGDDIATQYDMIELEHLGLLKMDFLGLITLTDIKKALDYIYEQHGVKIDFYNMEYNDPKVFEIIAAGRTEAIFQLESAGMRKFMKDLKPTCMDDIIAGISLYRPGPMDFIPMFVKNKQDPSNITYDHPLLENILDVTYGCIVYQEQVMKIFQVMGGYSLGQADNVRRMMGKKQTDKIEHEKVKFVNGWEDPTGRASIPGAIKLGCSKEIAEKIFDEMKEFAKYAFNKSHAAAYGFISYQTAYLKCYYEVEFLTAVLNNRITSADNISKYINFARSEGIPVLPPSVNKSGSYFKVENGGIRFGMGGLKHVGVAMTEKIEEEHNLNGPFRSLEDFINRMSEYSINRKMLECLILTGAFDEFGHSRSSCIAIYEKIMQKAQKDKKSKQNGQFSFFDNNTIDDSVEYPDIKEYSKKTLLKNERDIMGVYLSGHPLEDYISKFKDFTINAETINTLSKKDEDAEMVTDESGEEDAEVEALDGQPFVCGGIIVEFRKNRTKSGKDMAYIRLEDLTGVMDVVFFPAIYARYKEALVEENLVTIKGRINVRDGAISLVADNAFVWHDEEKKEMQNGKVFLRFDTKDIDVYSKVKRVLMAYPGSCQVIIRCSSSGSAFNYNGKVAINNYLVNELSGIIGNENLVIQEKK